jgi:outer membrane protein assembly factor BamB
MWAAGGGGSNVHSEATPEHGRGQAHGLGPTPSSGRLDQSAPARPPAVMAGLFPWQLPVPVSREVVLPLGPPGNLVVAGGMTAAGTTAGGAYRLDTKDGHLSFVGNLAFPTHDAASATVGATGLVFGGGSVAPGSTAQGLSPSGNTTVLSPLPRPRADATAVVIGPTAYIVGGYEGSQLDPEVLATHDGHSYWPVARLPVPVRYPAVATAGGVIYVFGGETATGAPVAYIQAVNPANRTAKVVGELPFALSGASAGNLGGVIYVAGGMAKSPTPASTLSPTSEVFAFDPADHSALRAGPLPVAVAYAGSAVEGGRLYLVGGEGPGGAQTGDVQFVMPDVHFGVAGTPGAGSPYYGYKLLIADRGNDRLLVLNDAGQVTWAYPSPTAPPPPGGFYYPDDAFFFHHGSLILSNQENNETLAEIAYPSGRVVWTYGHPRQAGSAPGYLSNPDDAYPLKDGNIVVADIMNCRILVIDPATKAVVHQIGTTGACVHNPPAYLGSPNGDTPLADGNLLVSEINGSWIDEYTLTGQLVWDVHLPIGYPSDPQQIGPDRYLVADYEDPGAFVEFNQAGQVLYRYQPTSGPGELNDPSLVELLPSGVLMANDDHNDRMVAIDPSTGAVVWQYGHTGVPGSAPGYLYKPDGFDILGPGGSTPTHPATA